jgi:hypothetical protein
MRRTRESRTRAFGDRSSGVSSRRGPGPCLESSVSTRTCVGPARGCRKVPVSPRKIDSKMATRVYTWT